MKLEDTKEYGNLFEQLKKANFSDNHEAIEGTLFLLCRHIETMAPVLKKSPAAMLNEISVNLINELQEITPSAGTRYFQLIGRNSNLISDRQYSLATAMKEQGVDPEQVLNSTGLVWCKADLAFKGFIFEPLTINDDTFRRMLDDPFHSYGIPLKDLLNEHPIFSAYNGLSRYDTSIQLLSDCNGFHNPEHRHISISLNKMREFMSLDDYQGAKNQALEILTHELQHAVQSLEGEWSRGNKPEYLNEHSIQQMIDRHKRRINKAFPVSEEEKVFNGELKKIADKYSLDDIYDAWDYATGAEYDTIEQLCEKIPFDNEREEAVAHVEHLQSMLDEQVARGKLDPKSWYMYTTGEIFAYFSEGIHKRIEQSVDDKGLSPTKAFFQQFKNASYSNHIHNGTMHIAKECEHTKQSLGFIDFYGNSQSVISLIKDKADLATWVHESLGHYVYENLLNASELDDAPKWIKETMESLDQSVFKDLTCIEAKHERFAELAEDFLCRPGEHQSPKLKAITKLIEKEMSHIDDYRQNFALKDILSSSQTIGFQNAFTKLTNSKSDEHSIEI